MNNVLMILSFLAALAIALFAAYSLFKRMPFADETMKKNWRIAMVITFIVVGIISIYYAFEFIF